MADSGPRGGQPRRSLALAAGVAVALIAGGLLTAFHHTARLLVPPRTAINAALHAPETAGALRGAHWNRIAVTPIDSQLEHVSFLERGQLVAEAAIDRSGQVVWRRPTVCRCPMGTGSPTSPPYCLG